MCEAGRREKAAYSEYSFRTKDEKTFWITVNQISIITYDVKRIERILVMLTTLIYTLFPSSKLGIYYLKVLNIKLEWLSTIHPVRFENYVRDRSRA